MRVSDISSWVTCEAMALSSDRPRRRMSAAVYVGILAHHFLFTGDQKTPPELPTRNTMVGWDALTPTFAYAVKQAKEMAATGQAEIQRKGLSLESIEETVSSDFDRGTLDMMVWSDTHGQMLLDLKTGRSIGAGWLQVGGYISLHEDDIRYGGILHIPRARLGSCQATLTLRHAKALMLLWEARRKRIDEVLEEGASPLHTPGDHCNRCSITDCPVRI